MKEVIKNRDNGFDMIKSYQLNVPADFLRLMKVESAKRDKTIKELIMEAVYRLVRESNRVDELR